MTIIYLPTLVIVSIWNRCNPDVAAVSVDVIMKKLSDRNLILLPTRSCFFVARLAFAIINESHRIRVLLLVLKFSPTAKNEQSRGWKKFVYCRIVFISTSLHFDFLPFYWGTTRGLRPNSEAYKDICQKILAPKLTLFDWICKKWINRAENGAWIWKWSIIHKALSSPNARNGGSCFWC